MSPCVVSFAVLWTASVISLPSAIVVYFSYTFPMGRILFWERCIPETLLHLKRATACFFQPGRVFPGSGSRVCLLGLEIKSSVQKRATKLRPGGVGYRHPATREGLRPHIPARACEVGGRGSPAASCSPSPSPPTPALADKGTEVEVRGGICAASQESALPRTRLFIRKARRREAGGCTNLEQLSRGKKGCEKEGRAGNEGFLKFPLHPGRRKKQSRGPRSSPDVTLGS